MTRFEHGGDIYSRNVKIDFSANINPFGMPEEAVKALKNAEKLYNVYPDPMCRKLTERISAFENIYEEDILCGSGAADIIYRIVNAVRPKKAVLFVPTFSEYERALISLRDCEICLIELSEENDFRLTPNMADRIPDNTDLVFLCSPNNPTGAAVSREVLDAVSERCNNIGARLVVDECFMDFSENADELSAKYLLEKGVVIIKAFTKIFAMAGLRLGYALCDDEELLEKMRMAGPDWAVSTPAQIAGAAAADDEEYLQHTKIYIARERRFLTEAFTNLSFRVFPSEADFLLVKTRIPIADILWEKGILVRRCDNFRGLDNTYYRFATRSHEDNVKLIIALGKGVFRWLKQ